MRRKLTPEQIIQKSALLSKMGRDVDSDWRLARVDATIESLARRIVPDLKTGDICIAHKEEDPGAAMPKIVVFAERTGRLVNLTVTDPIEFLED